MHHAITAEARKDICDLALAYSAFVEVFDLKNRSAILHWGQETIRLQSLLGVVMIDPDKMARLIGEFQEVMPNMDHILQSQYKSELIRRLGNGEWPISIEDFKAQRERADV